MRSRTWLVTDVDQEAVASAVPEGSQVVAGQKEAIALELVGIVKLYDHFAALSNVTIQTRAGSIHALIGSNGAGKSTLVGVAAGEMRPQHGTVLLWGRDITKYPPWRRARLGLGRSFQSARLFEDLSVRGNVEVSTAAGMGKAFRLARQVRPVERKLAAEVLDRVQMTGNAGRLARDLSQGDRKRLELACCIASGARVLILDEPLAGLSVAEVEIVVQVLRSLRDDHGTTLLLIEHDIDAVLALADVVSVLDNGKIIFEGTPQTVVASELVQAAYLTGTAYSADADDRST
jgi:branched-chain amino acid transport system ATP-binding protein